MKLPRRVLVVGLARSGQAAALALAKRDVSVIGFDRAEVDPDDPHATPGHSERRGLARAGQAENESPLRKQTLTRSGSRGRTRTRRGSPSRSRSGP